MILFRGVQTGRVDDKGRLKLPALVRNRLEERYGSREVFITSLTGEEAKVYPLSEWEAFEARITQKSTEGKEEDGEIKNKILFQANRYGAEETLDNQGRLLVPAVLRETAGMRGEVKIVWSGNHMLVMNAKRFDEESVEMRLSKEELRHAANLGA